MHPDRKNIDQESELPKGIHFDENAIWNSVQLPKKKKPKAWFWVAAASVTILLIDWWLTRETPTTTLAPMIASKSLPEATTNPKDSEMLALEETTKEIQLSQREGTAISNPNQTEKMEVKINLPEVPKSVTENQPIKNPENKDILLQEIQPNQLVAETATAKPTGVSLEKVTQESLSPAARRLQANLQAQQIDLPVKEIEINEPFRLLDMWATKFYVSNNQPQRNESLFTTLTTKNHEKN